MDGQGVRADRRLEIHVQAPVELRGIRSVDQPRALPSASRRTSFSPDRDRVTMRAARVVHVESTSTT
jgi:hypothetical protein